MSTVLVCAGCGQPAGKGFKTIETPREKYAADGKRIAADPVAFLRELKQRCETLDAYTLTFNRQERLGLLTKSLAPMETMRARFRKDPFSVKFDWDDPKSDYVESTYVANQNDGKLIVRERKGIFPFPPAVRQIDPELPAKIGKARNPITNFGLAKIATRTLLPFEDAKLAEVMTITYEGLVDLEPMNRPCHHLKIERPPTEGYDYTVQDFYVNAETLLPAGTDLYLKSGELDARYRYADVNTDVTLTDEDFRLDERHPESTSGEGS